MPTGPADFYLAPLNIFTGDKEPHNQLTYKGFEIQRFRGLEAVSLEFKRNELVTARELVVGLKPFESMAGPVPDYIVDLRDWRFSQARKNWWARASWCCS